MSEQTNDPPQIEEQGGASEKKKKCTSQTDDQSESPATKRVLNGLRRTKQALREWPDFYFLVKIVAN